MQDLNIDLGKTADEGCIPCAPATVSEKGEPKKYYPSLYLDGLKDLDLPKEGKLLITYRLKSETHRETEDKESHSFEIEVRELVAVDGEQEEKKTASDDFEDRMKSYKDE